ncbi:MAG: hypothetical protein ABWZ87_09600 [Aeromicrobium sp.]
MLKILVGYAVIALVLIGYVVVIQDGDAGAWQIAAWSFVGVVIGDLFFGALRRRKSNESE